MAAVYQYCAFGMKIASQIPIPELQPCSGMPDINIAIGKVPKEIEGAIDSNAYYQAGKNQLLFHITNVGSYYIKNGNQIMIEPAPNAEKKAIRLFLLGSAMGAILFQRGFFPIHGSAVVVNEYCFIVTGNQGAGKSTLTAALRKKGYAILTDDIAAVAFDAEGIPWVYPSYPQQKLWKDSLESMGHEVSSLSNIYGRIDKYAVTIQDKFCETPKKLVGIYEVRKEICQNVNMNKLSGMDKLATIMNNIYRLSFVSGLNLKEETFRYSAALAKQVSVSRITRLDSVFCVEDQINLIESDLQKGSEINESAI
ncbi:hypothetical protein [Candidatus Formimonas warabiya]|uniref:HPr kinase/phosphorylase C-terminal domain-containing protein n=1 Tax=Formimonas warabiya TaxID=1761012 RepID=A0A3G1L0J7_FORW1|nr:hypothetical protein [Candidatus Formimonas warabiya]ATW28171.1 hypothetical protein DCMF_28495 [Candidatus Formimonas warabiya]